MSSIQLTFYIQPGAHKTEIVGKHGDYIKIRLQAPPVDGKANQSLIEFIAKKLAVKAKAIRIIRGEKSRIKTLEISDLSLSFTNCQDLELYLLPKR